MLSSSSSIARSRGSCDRRLAPASKAAYVLWMHHNNNKPVYDGSSLIFPRASLDSKDEAKNNELCRQVLLQWMVGPEKSCHSMVKTLAFNRPPNKQIKSSWPPPRFLHCPVLRTQSIRSGRISLLSTSPTLPCNSQILVERASIVRSSLKMWVATTR